MNHDHNVVSLGSLVEVVSNFKVEIAWAHIVSEDLLLVGVKLGKRSKGYLDVLLVSIHLLVSKHPSLSLLKGMKSDLFEVVYIFFDIFHVLRR